MMWGSMSLLHMNRLQSPPRDVPPVSTAGEGEAHGKDVPVVAAAVLLQWPPKQATEQLRLVVPCLPLGN